MLKPALLCLAPLPLLCLGMAAGQSTAGQASTKADEGYQQATQRLLGFTLPNSLVIEGRDAHPPRLSSAQKFEQVGKSFFNPFTFFGASVQAGFDQALDEHQRYGQGGEAYGKRYGASITDAATGLFFGVGVYPTLMHTDPRYYRTGTGTFISRSMYAVTRVLVTRRDSGHHIFNAPEILAKEFWPDVRNYLFHH